MENEILEAALNYSHSGYCVIPMRSVYDADDKEYKKKPYIKWEKYQTEKSTDDDIKSWWRKWPQAMIGIITGNFYKLVVIDCDSDESYQKIQELIPDNLITPIAATPRGGRHLWFHSNGDKVKSTTAFLPKTDSRGEGGIIIAPPSVNSEGKQYIWIIPPDEAAPQELPYNILKYIIEEDRKDVVSLSVGNTTLSNTTNIILQKGTRTTDLFKIGMALADGYYKHEEIKQVLKILGKNSTPAFSDETLEEKIKSIFESILKKERNLAQEVLDWCLLQKGVWNTTLTRQELHITTKRDIKNLSVIVNRLEEKGIVEKVGEKRGEYRTRGDEAKTEMDLLSDDLIQEVDVKLPIDLNEMCIISPGNICVVAGTKSSGKTAFLLNIAWLNKDKFDVVYLNSEMHPTEFKKRMKKFAPLDKWRMTGHKCHTNFHDYMDGDRKKIFIVDYLEVNTNFYEIGTPIRKIHERLGDSICFIGIQMKAGAELGRGGDFSAEKARLYLTMDYNKDEKHTKVTIYDAKEPRPPHDNVRDKFRRVKIIDGHKLSPSDNWRWPNAPVQRNI